MFQMYSDADKKQLAKKLGIAMRLHGYTQSFISKEIHVDQSLISRVLNCDFKRRTPSLLRLENYVNMLNKKHALPDDVKASVQTYVMAGGDTALLCENIAILTQAFQSGPRLRRINLKK